MYIPQKDIRSFVVVQKIGVMMFDLREYGVQVLLPCDHPRDSSLLSRLQLAPSELEAWC